MEGLYIFAGVFIGILLGLGFALISFRRMDSGILKICIPDDPREASYTYLESSKTIDSIGKQGHVIFKVDVVNIKTQK